MMRNNDCKGFILFAGLLILLLTVGLLCGCQATSQRAVIETSVPNVWSEQPTQAISIKMEFAK